MYSKSQDAYKKETEEARVVEVEIQVLVRDIYVVVTDGGL